MIENYFPPGKFSSSGLCSPGLLFRNLFHYILRLRKFLEHELWVQVIYVIGWAKLPGVLQSWKAQYVDSSADDSFSLFYWNQKRFLSFVWWFLLQHARNSIAHGIVHTLRVIIFQLQQTFDWNKCFCFKCSGWSISHDPAQKLRSPTDLLLKTAQLVLRSNAHFTMHSNFAMCKYYVCNRINNYWLQVIQ